MVKIFSGTKQSMTLKVGMQHRVLEYNQVCSYDDPGLTLTYLMAVKFGPLCFCMGKVKIMDFSETNVVYVIVGRFSQLNEYMNRYEYQRSRSFIDLHPSSLGFNIFKLLLLRNH